MSDILVTVVLPVYSVENYINRCVESVVNQTYKNLEILMIDDGSPDNCPAICDAWAEKDNRIRVIHKVNEGLSMARNTGIEEAQGKYIFFLDSDDYVEDNLIACCVEIAEKTVAQIVVYGYDRIDKDGKVLVSSVPELPSLVMRGDEIRRFTIPCLAGPMLKDGKKYHIVSSAWGAMYSLDTIRKHNFRFVSEREIISEDIYSNLVFYQYIDCIAIIPTVFYHYCENNAQSLTRLYNPNRFELNKYFYLQVINLCDELCYSEQTKKNLSNQTLSNIIASIKQIVNSGFPKQKTRTLIQVILNDDVTRKVLNDYDINLDRSIFRKTLIICMKHRYVNFILIMFKIKNLL